MPQNYSAWIDPRLAAQPQVQPDALSEEDLLMAQGLAQNGVPAGVQLQEPQQQKTAQDLSIIEAYRQADKAQQQSMMEQQAGVRQMEDFVNQYKSMPRELDFSGIAAFADAYGPFKTNLAGVYKKPPTEQERAEKIFELQNKLQQQKEGMTKSKYENLKSKIDALKAMKENPLKDELTKSQIRALNAAAGAKENPPEKEIKPDQAAASTYGRRLEQAEAAFEALAKKGYDRALTGESANSYLPGAMQSENLKLQEQAERNFINAVLRRESGAAISPTEFTSAEQQYFDRPGDTPEVKAQKKANRLQAKEGMKLAAGHAWDKTSAIAPKKERTAKDVMDEIDSILRMGKE